FIGENEIKAVRWIRQMFRLGNQRVGGVLSGNGDPFRLDLDSFYIRGEALAKLARISADAAAHFQDGRVFEIGPSRYHLQASFLPAAPNVTWFAALGGKVRRHGTSLCRL